MKLKVCGMKFLENIESAIDLRPDYMGFIFYEKSTRNYEGDGLDLPSDIKKVGVFVNSPQKEVLDAIDTFNLNAVQLHGDESPDYCRSIKGVEIIKAFSVDSNFNFEVLRAYEEVCDYYLFDTKGKLRGGNGIAFDWNLLKDYPSQKEYFLSGGIGMEEIVQIQEFNKSSLSKYCVAIDINSKFEIQPGLKDIEKINFFKNKLNLVFN